MNLIAIRRAARKSAPLLTTLLLLSSATPALATSYFVTVGGQSLTFSPQTLDITAGDTVTFLNFGGLHNVVADDGSFRCAHGCDNDGHGGSGTASGQLWSVTIPFPNAGTVGYFCEIHGAPGIGMFGTINVAPAAPPPPPPASTDAVPLGALLLAGLAALLALAAAPRLGRRARRR